MANFVPLPNYSPSVLYGYVPRERDYLAEAAIGVAGDVAGQFLGEYVDNLYDTKDEIAAREREQELLNLRRLEVAETVRAGQARTDQAIRELEAQLGMFDKGLGFDKEKFNRSQTFTEEMGRGNLADQTRRTDLAYQQRGDQLEQVAQRLNLDRDQLAEMIRSNRVREGFNEKQLSAQTSRFDRELAQRAEEFNITGQRQVAADKRDLANKLKLLQYGSNNDFAQMLLEHELSSPMTEAQIAQALAYTDRLRSEADESRARVKGTQRDNALELLSNSGYDPDFAVQGPAKSRTPREISQMMSDRYGLPLDDPKVINETRRVLNELPQLKLQHEAPPEIDNDRSVWGDALWDYTPPGTIETLFNKYKQRVQGE